MADPKKPRAPFAPWDRRELPGAFAVEESARRVGNYKWIEMRLFEVLGGWVATVPELDVKMRLGTHCYHHAWHAELWHKRLPELREMNPERLTVPANDELVAFIDAMTEPEAPELTIEKLVGVYRVLIPHKIAAYTYHLNNTSTITDAPTIRSLKFVLAGRVRGLARRRDAASSRCIETDDEVERAAAHQAKLEKLMLAAGGIAGPGIDRHAARRTRGGSSVMRKALPGRGARPRRALRPRRDAGAPQRPACRARRTPTASGTATGSRPTRPDAPDAARALMHGIFVGEIQALEGAGRTCWDFDDRQRATTRRRSSSSSTWPASAGTRPATARSPCKLGDWMGTEIGEFSESTFLYEAACNPDPVLRLTGVNRALEGLAIDVFNTMKEFGDDRRRPGARVLRGLDARRRGHPREDGLRLAAPPHRQRPRAPRAARSSSSAIVDKLFTLGGFRGEDDEQPDPARPPLPRAGRLRRPTRSTRSPSSPRRRCTRPTTSGVRFANGRRRQSRRHDRHRHPRDLHDGELRRGRDRGDRRRRCSIRSASPMSTSRSRSTRRAPGPSARRVARPGGDRGRERRARGPEAAPAALARPAPPTCSACTAPSRRPSHAGLRDAPADDDLTLPQSVAWEVYSIGRLERLGYHVAAPALALPLPQPARLHRRRRRRVRAAVGRTIAHVGRDRRALRGRDRARARRLIEAT